MSQPNDSILSSTENASIPSLNHAKRNRAQLSCTQCRTSKLKCDRKEPCSQCVKKGRESSCTFLAPLPRRKPAASMQNRLRHLESLVKDVMSGQTLRAESGVGSGSTASSQENPSSETGSRSHSMDEGNLQIPNDYLSNAQYDSSFGQVLLDSNRSTYVGATHWAAILDDIEEVKDYFETIETSDPVETENILSSTKLTFSLQSSCTKEEILAGLPNKLAVDRLISRYFNSNSPSLHILHRPKFQREYKKFWLDPHDAPVAWIALLYSLMSLATFAGLGTGEVHPDNRGAPLEMIRSYRNYCIQSLILSNYTKPGPYTIEALITSVEAEFLLSSQDGQVHLYLYVGNIIRLALRMGLHRDSSKVGGNITPFQAEFRRRVWYHLTQLDLLSSFHIGLPGMAEAIESDTLYPRNLRDEDFDEDSIELPPSRPESELTATTYLIYKSKLCHEAGKVSTLANRLTLPPYDEIMKLDYLLCKVYEDSPAFFKIKHSEFSITDSPELIIKKFSLALVFQKSRCMLHRKYFMKAGGNPEYAYSKQVVLEASLELLNCQSMSYESTLPGGPLARDQWFLSTLSMHDFLLAAMIVCINITQAASELNDCSNISNEVHEQNSRLVAALEKSHKIWTEMQVSHHAQKASALLEAMLKKVSRALESSSSCKETPFNGALSTNNSSGHFVSGLSLEDVATPIFSYDNRQTRLEPWQTGISDENTPSSGSGVQFEGVSMTVPDEQFRALINIPDDFDWETFDNHIWPKPTVDQPWPNFNSETSTSGNANYTMFNPN